MTAGDSDLELVRKFQETGDARFVKQLFDRYQRQVYSKCLRFFRGDSIAEDITREVFIRLLATLNAFRGGNVGAWLYTVAGRACIDHARKLAREKPWSDAHLLIPSGEQSAEEQLEWLAAARKLEIEMTRLPSCQQRCLEMIGRGYTYEEISEFTGLSVKKVKSHIQNGRRKLLARMKGVLPWHK